MAQFFLEDHDANLDEHGRSQIETIIQLAGRADALQQFAIRLGDLVSIGQIEQAIESELVTRGIARRAELLPPAPRDPRTAASFTSDPHSSGSVGILPLISPAGETLANLRAETDSSFTPEDRTYLQAVAAYTSTALDRLARFASLTSLRRSGAPDLPNRDWWREAIEDEIEHARRTRGRLTVVMVEPDDFDGYNATHGHVAGDRLLLSISDAWRMAGFDLVSPAGDEQLATLLRGKTDRDARTLAASITRVPPLMRSFCVGIAQWDGHEASLGLIARAQNALADEQLSRARANAA